MAEGTVRTADGEDQARYLRSLDDRIAALERETIVIPEPAEPCCVCDSFSLLSAGETFDSCDPIGSHTFDPLACSVVDWIIGTPTPSGGGAMLGTPGKWLIAGHFSIGFGVADITNAATLFLVSGAQVWVLASQMRNSLTMELEGSALISATAGTSVRLRAVVLTPGVSITVNTANHGTRLQGFLTCAET